MKFEDRSLYVEIVVQLWSYKYLGVSIKIE